MTNKHLSSPHDEAILDEIIQSYGSRLDGLSINQKVAMGYSLLSSLVDLDKAEFSSGRDRFLFMQAHRLSPVGKLELVRALVSQLQTFALKL